MDIRKRGRNDGGFSANGGHKKSKQEMDSSGVGSKLKPCTKFFSTAGCPFGESCHFLHYVPGGYNAVAQIMNLAPALAPLSRNMRAPSPAANGSAQSSVKSRMCSKYNTAEGCKYGDKCHYAHGEWELGRPVAVSYDDPRAVGTIPGRMGGPPGPATAAGFGASATAKISVEASLAGAIIGKGGVNSKQICRQTGAKLSIRDHEADPNLKNIEFEGSFEQIKQASGMVSELIASVSSAQASAKVIGARGGFGQGHGHGRGQGQGYGRGQGQGQGYGRGQGHGPGYGPGSNNFKTKICENFNKGSCTFGDKCHFAHGAAELRAAPPGLDDPPPPIYSLAASPSMAAAIFAAVSSSSLNFS